MPLGPLDIKPHADLSSVSNISIGTTSTIDNFLSDLLNKQDKTMSLGYEANATHVGSCVITSEKYTSNGPYTFNCKFRGRAGEGIRFDNGSRHPITSKRYNNTMSWSYKPANPHHWENENNKFIEAPTSVSEALDRLAKEIYKLKKNVNVPHLT